MFSPDDRPQAFWGGEKLEVTFTGQAVKADYGVPGSPTWTEIEEIEILDVWVRPETLPGAPLAKIHALSAELDW